MNFNTELQKGKPLLPKALCIFNKDDGYKVLNLSRDFKSDDIKNYGINFDDSTHTIKIDSVIDIQSKAKAKIDIENNLLEKINSHKIDPRIYSPTEATKYIRPDVIKSLIKKKDG